MAKTPLWFKEWENNAFFHFKSRIEFRTKLALWLSGGILLSLVIELVRRFIWG